MCKEWEPDDNWSPLLREPGFRKKMKLLTRDLPLLSLASLQTSQRPDHQAAGSCLSLGLSTQPVGSDSGKGVGGSFLPHI